MATTIKGLKTAFKKANRRADKAIKRYIDTVHGLWVKPPLSIGLEHLTDYCLRYDKRNNTWRIASYASEVDYVFYKRGRGQKMLARQWGELVLTSVKTVDIADLLKLENAIDAAIDDHEKIWTQLKDLGVDVWNDAELWQ